MICVSQISVSFVQIIREVLFTLNNALVKSNPPARLEKSRVKGVKFSLIVKVILINVLLITLVSAVVNFIIYTRSTNTLADQIRDKLIMVAANSALCIDAEKIKQISGPEDEGGPVYTELQAKLQEIQKASHGKLRFIYIVKKTGNNYTYLVDATPGGDENHSTTGDKFEDDQYPDSRNGFLYPTADQEMRADPKFHTSSQSGYAPIKDAAGNTAGMIGIDMDVTVLSQEKYEMWKAAVVAFFTSIALALFLSIFFALYLTKPVSLLTKATRKISGGNFDTTVTVKRNDELGLLAESFNLMTLDLKNSHETLKQYNLELEEKVRQRTAEITLVNKEIKDILDNISQAIFTIDHKLHFNPQYSRFAPHLFGNVQFAGKSLLEVFFPIDNQMAERNQLQSWLQQIFELDSLRSWSNLKSLQPIKEISVRMKNENNYEVTKYIQLDFQPVTNTVPGDSRETVTKVMVIAQDITARKTLELEIEAKEKEHKDNINQIVEIIKMDRELFQDYIDECKEHLVEFEPKLIQLKDDRSNMDLVNDLFRIMHTIKGNARIFKLERIENEAHNVENILNTIRKNEKIMTDELLDEIFKRLDRFNEIFNGMLDIYNKISQGKSLDTGKTRSGERQRDESEILRVRVQEIDRLAELIKKAEAITAGMQAAQTVELRNLFVEAERQFRVIRKVNLGKLFVRMPRLVRDLSTELGKKVHINIKGDQIEVDKNIFDKLSDPIIHLLRNCLDHGIEKPEERVALGKPAEGTIELEASLNETNLMVEISDDGKGINLEQIKAKAVKRGLLTPEMALEITDQEAINLIFTPGFSTSDQVNAISGRGVGMDVVKNTIEEILKGNIQLITHPHHGLKVRLTIPLAG
jgi:two-component system chemotaxis sensor kinase CheA